MAVSRSIICGQNPGRKSTSRQSSIYLNLWGNDPNINLKTRDISRRMTQDLNDVMLDLIEIAAYVYVADQRVTRGGLADMGMGSKWRRSFDFRIPVRQQSMWDNSEVKNALISTLRFLSEDEYAFNFTKALDPPSSEPYFEFNTEHATAFRLTK